MSILEDKKALYRVYERKEEKLMIQLARRLNLPEDGEPFWVLKSEYFDDPITSDIKVKYDDLTVKMNALYWEIAELEHDPSNPRMNYYARKKVAEFLDALGTSYEACEFLKSIGMTTHELIESVAINPEVMDGVFL